MSDVIVSTTESTTNVTTSNDVTTIAVTDQIIEVSASTAGVQGPPGSNSDPTYVFVTNKTGVQLSKGAIVYVSGANGVHTQVSLALATGDVTSARTLGWMAENVADNATGLCMVEGYLDGVNTQGITEGAQLYLSPTVAGGFTSTKPQAPQHLVYVGVCAKASSGNGRVFVKVQNGYELEELHNVRIVSVANNDVIRYNSGTSLWENVAASAVTVGSATNASTATYAVTSGTASFATASSSATNAATAITISGSITKSQVSDFTSGTVTSASTAQQSGTAVYATSAGSALVSGTATTISGSITRSQITDFASGTVAVATNASTATYAVTSGTSVFATNSSTAVSLSGSITRSQVSDFTSGTVTSASTAEQAGTATYATTSATSVTISGSITRSQVSDFASGTVTNISGTVAQSQVTNLTSDLANRFILNANNTATGAQIFNANTDTAVPLQIRRASATATGNMQEWDTSTGTALATIDVSGRGNFPQVSVGSTANLGYGQLSVNTGGTANKGLVVRAVANQNANLQEWQDSNGGTVLGVISTGGLFGTGRFGFGNTGPTAGVRVAIASGSTADIPLRITAVANQSGDLFQALNSANSTVVGVSSGGALYTGASAVGQLTSIAASSATIGLVVRGAASQSVNLQEWQNSGGTAVANVNSAGLISSTRQIGVVQTNAGETMIVARGAVSQTGDAIAVRDSNGNTVGGFSATGRLFSGVSVSGQTALGGLTLGSGTAISQFGVISSASTVVGSVIRGAASQTASLSEWQTSATAVVMAIRQENDGGVLRVTKGTATASAPGANVAAIYLRDGTNANTLKLVVRAGTAGAETTILDNIPTA